MSKQPPNDPAHEGPQPQMPPPSGPQWYGQTAPLPTSGQPMWQSTPGQPGPFGQPGQPGAPTQSDAAHAGTTRTRTDRSRRRWMELPIVAILAAGLASGTTYAVTDHGSTTPAAVSSSSSVQGAPADAAPVSQANPSAPNWSVTAAAVSPSVVAITVRTPQGGAQGSGVIMDTKGHIITNNHVVADLGNNGKLTVTLHDQRTYDATVVGTDPSTDLAVVQIKNAPKDLNAIAFGDATTLKVGDPVMAVGNPLGLAGTVTTGIVSALNRPVTTGGQSSGPMASGSEPVVTNAVQTSAAINPGNSGGALVNASGQLIGINSAIATLGTSGTQSSQSGNIGIGFAIPVNEVKSITQQLISKGRAEHAFLGVSTQDVRVQDGAARRAAAGISKVVPGTPAAKAGFKSGDAVVAIDGDAVDGSLSLVAQVRERTVGDKTTFTVVRNGKRQDITATLASKAAQTP